MCGRYRLSRRKQLIEEYFNCVSEDDPWYPRYNIAPTQFVPVIRKKLDAPQRELSLLRWGLIPSWSQDASGAANMINARSETVDTKPAFRDAMRYRRCLVPADGFYEWEKDGKTKQPYCFELGEGDLFAFAGIWESWNDTTGKNSGPGLETFSILTTTAKAAAAVIHDRMPIILTPDAYDLWLDPQMTDSVRASDLLETFDASKLRRFPVSSRVNQVTNDDEACSALVEPAVVQERLF